MKDSYYLKHDYGARNDPKLVKAAQKHGIAALGVYWCLVEMLYEQGGQLPMELDVLAYDLRVSEDLVKSIIADFGLFQNDGKTFWSNAAKSRLAQRAEKIEIARAAGKASAMKRKAGAEKSTDVERTLNGRSTRRGEERREEDKREEKEIEGVASPAASAATPQGKTLEEKISARQKRETAFYASLTPYLDEYGRKMLREFFDYWREPTKSGIKMRWETKPTWDLSLRLKTWQRNDDKFSTSTRKSDDAEIQDTAAAKILAAQQGRG